MMKLVAWDMVKTLIEKMDLYAKVIEQISNAMTKRR
jgi:hypothetical protein